MKNDYLQYIPPKEGRRDFMRLDFNENGRGPSPKVLEALQALDGAALATYPEYGPLLTMLSNMLNVSKDEVLFTNGSGEAIEFIIKEYLSPGDEVILLDPTFSLFEVLCRRVSATIVSVPYNPEDFSFPKEEVMAAIESKTQMLIIANPNNPTGTLVSTSDLEEIIENNPHMIVMIDEAYGQFAGINNSHLCFKYPNVFVIRTFSKAYGLAALRLGYVISQRENIARLQLQSLPFNVNQVSVVAAQAALQDPQYLDAYIGEVIKARALLQKAMTALGFTVYPSAANFLLVNFGNKAETIRDRLLDTGILIRDFSNKASMMGCLRLSIGTLEQTRTLIQQIQTICKKADCLLFDMDGVLIDESESYRQCIIKVVNYFAGQAIDISLIEQYKNKGGYNNDYDCALAILADMNVKINRETLIEKFQDFYLGGLYNNERWIMPAPLLIELAKYYKLGIVTGRPRDEAKNALTRFGMQGFFDVLITADDVKEGKPSPTGLLKAIESLKAQSALYVGDVIDDALAAKAAKIPFIAMIAPQANIDKATAAFKENGINTILTDASQLSSILLPDKKLRRQGEVVRKTKETDITIRLNIDGTGESCCDTGIGFFDHMMATFAKHGLFDIDIQCNGDLQVDQHHTIEDLGIALGKSFSQALGSKRGIKRTGYFVFPMDESRSICAVDIINRPYLQYDVTIDEKKIGDFETINLSNFFAGFVSACSVTLHIDVRGNDPHHRVEAMFKAFGKTMKMACECDERVINRVPSTKGKI